MSINMKIEGIDGLEKTLNGMSSIRWTSIVKKNVTEMFNRAKGTNPSEGGTPVSSEKTRPGGPHGELRQSVKKIEDGISWTKDYAAHVNYGHRVVVHGKQKGYIPGQHYATNNLIIQRPIYTADLLNAIRKEMK